MTSQSMSLALEREQSQQRRHLQSSQSAMDTGKTCSVAKLRLARCGSHKQAITNSTSLMTSTAADTLTAATATAAQVLAGSTDTTTTGSVRLALLVLVLLYIVCYCWKCYNVTCAATAACYTNGEQ
jgi:hypothetical protein